MKKKPERGLKALASGSLTVARMHNVLDSTEKQLEHEIARENRVAKTASGRARQMGEVFIHSKPVLFCIVILNIVDCILVLGELILDMYYIKAVMESSEAVSTSFIIDMKTLYPKELVAIETDIKPLYKQILDARIEWDNLTYGNVKSTSQQENSKNNIENSKRIKRAEHIQVANISLSSQMQSNHTNYHKEYYKDNHAQSIEVILAHAFHKASITILCILAAETLFKIFAYGKEFFHRRLEVFDCGVVLCSLFVDIYFLKGISAFKIQDFVIILAFLVPWRVIRVVNSLVVAVIDHEHFRLKLLYKQKKDISNELKKCKADAKTLQQCLDVVKNMALSEGISEQKIAQHLALLTQGKSKSKGSGSFRGSLYFKNLQSKFNTSSEKLHAKSNYSSKTQVDKCHAEIKPKESITVNMNESLHKIL